MVCKDLYFEAQYALMLRSPLNTRISIINNKNRINQIPQKLEMDSSNM